MDSSTSSGSESDFEGFDPIPEFENLDLDPYRWRDERSEIDLHWIWSSRDDPRGKGKSSQAREIQVT